VQIMKRFNGKGWLIAILIAVTLNLQSACTPPSPGISQPNQTPVIERINYAPDTFANSDSLIECSAKDADGDNLTYQWKAEAGQISGSGPSVIWMSPGKMGTYPITLVVADGKGGVATENISIRVATNADGTATPTVEIKLKLGDAGPVIVDKQRARIWMTTDILCIVENAGDGGDLTYTWSSTGGKIQGKGLEEGKADKIRWTAPGVRSDVTISVTVKDGQGKEAKGQVNMNVFCCGN
jgi:hypothetical protein